MTYAFVLAAGIMAGCLSGIVGAGSSIILLPILVFAFGAAQVVPIMAIAALMSNAGKIWAWRREIDWRAVGWFTAAAVPAAVLGARTLLMLPPNSVELGLGLFFLAMVPVRRWLHARDLRIAGWQLALCGAAIGFITGIAMATGPLMIPAFAAYGLLKGALLSSEAVSSLFVTSAKIATFRSFGAMPPEVALKGLVVGSSAMAGTFLGKLVVEKMSGRTYALLLDAMLVIAGSALLVAAFT